MADGFQLLSEHLRRQIPDALSALNPEWRAPNPESRLKIRQHIASRLPALTEAERDQLMDLSRPPRLPAWSISISHTLDRGGWIAVPRPARIGFDVEVVSRLRPAVIERVCTPEELTVAPDRLLLWSAKEAFFKCLEDDQPSAFASLSLANWRASPDAGGFEFQCEHGNRRAQGLVRLAEGLSFAYCVSK